jgi:1,2-diacylglycerol 3-beta-galactosyltransferase
MSIGPKGFVLALLLSAANVFSATSAAGRATSPPPTVGRVRSLSVTGAGVLCLLCQSYTEGHVAAMPISAALGVCGSLISGTQKTPSFLARFHAVPLAQGYVAASIVRWAARILYRMSPVKPRATSIAPPAQPRASAGAGTAAAAHASPRSILGAGRRRQQPAPPRLAPVATLIPAKGIPMFPGSPSAAVGPRSAISSLARRPKQKVLILMSDTGGGHRASAQALAEVLAQRHGDKVETAIVDVWTLYGPWPFGQELVPYYRELAKRPLLWWAHFRASSLKPAAYLMSQLMSAVCYRGFEQCIREHAPDVVISMHPLCQAVPIKVLRRMHRDELEAAAAAVHPGARAARRIPFVTVVTDLATPHPFWLHPRADLCFVPSDSFHKAATDRGLARSQLRQHGLPVRPGFSPKRVVLATAPGAVANGSSWVASRAVPSVLSELGLLPDRHTVLLVGGGDGVGKLGEIVHAMAQELAEYNAAGGAPSWAPAQMAVVCGKNQELCQQLQARDWGPHLHVAVVGFTSRMSDYMGVASCIVTKAGPGTIAEACCSGLPIMLSGYLPGQESGNVAFVVDGGFGAYASEPAKIASTVASWLAEPQRLAQMSERSLLAARPLATERIADDIIELIRPNRVEPRARKNLWARRRTGQKAAIDRGPVLQPA